MVLEPRGGQAALIAPRAKPIPNVQHSHATHRQGDSFIDKAKGSSWLLQTGDPIWETESSRKWPLPSHPGHGAETQPHPLCRVSSGLI